MRAEADEPSAGSGEGAVADEAGLVERVKQGDPSAYDALVRRHARQAFAVAYRLLGHREDAEDLVQDAFLRALERIDRFESGRPFGPWLYRILVNLGHNTRKARARRATEPLAPDTPARTDDPARTTEQKLLKERLARALADLPERQRLIVQLFELEGFSGPEIGAMLDMPDGTVRWHLHQARRALREALAPMREVTEHDG